MRSACRIIPLLCLKLLFCFLSYAQEALPDSGRLSSSTNSLWSFYDGSIKENLHLYNGREYLRNSQLIKGSPYAIADDLLDGSVFYDGILYQHVDINFDISTNQVVIRDFSKSFPIVLVPEKINYFSIGDHFFARIFISDSAEINSKGTMCERIFESTAAKVYVRREKKLYRPLNALTEDNMSVYKVYEKYFIFYDRNYASFSSLKEMIKLLGPDAAKVKKYARSSSIKLNKISDEDLKKVLSYYTQIKS
jgi:hypothetical protein